MKRLLTAALAALSIAMPVQARIDPNTDELLNAMQSDGIQVAVNSSLCKRNDIHGSFTFRPGSSWRLLTLCPGLTVDDLDHSTVRHEAIHAIQWCANNLRGASYNTPLLNDYKRFQQEVFAELYVSEIERIHTYYDEADYYVEYEAHLYERTKTSAEILHLYNAVCGPMRPYIMS